MDSPSQFDAAYWLAQPPEVRALETIDDQDVRSAQGAALAIKGFTIDIPIMVWGWDPYKVMTMRVSYGYTWVPSALQPSVSIAPGLGAPGATPYDPLHPPGGSIKVSTNLADYPPFDVPVPAQATTLVTDPVGLQSVGTLYLTVPGDATEDGGKFTDARGTFLKHVVLTPFGRSTYWEKVA